ncbi:uncharacterized protein [Haliotis cracherodii]|uniref:uncharacterized protein n=1 Tax=Haliotis cracherodii TaxID=6455 RepID=UPI0039E7D009
MSLTASETRTLQYLLQVSKPAHNPLVTVAGLTAIFEFVKSTDDWKVVQYLLEEGLADVLVSCLDTWTPGGKNQDIHGVLVMLALKVTHHLASMSPLVLRPLMTVRFYTSLLLLTDTKGDFFRFSCEFQEMFSLLTRGKQLIANVVIETVGGDVKQHLGSILKYPVDLPGCIYRCSCFDTSGETDVNITQQLMSEGLAWPTLNIQGGEMKDWKDVIVTEHLRDQYFYALLGEAAIRQAAAIKSIIENVKGDLHVAAIEVGKIVLMVVVRDGQLEHVRGQVVSYVGEWVKATMLEYGGVREVRLKNVFELPSALSLMYFPAQTSLCYLAGVQAPPSDVYTLQLALASMCNLIRFCVASGLTLLKTGCLTYLLPVLRCPDSSLVLQTLRILNNLATNPHTDKTVFEPVLHDLLELLRSVPDKSWSVNVREDTSYTCMSCIANILTFSRHYRSAFYQNEGLSTVLRILVCYKPFRPVYKMGTQLLRNFLYVTEVKATQRRPPDGVEAPKADMLTAGSTRSDQTNSPQRPVTFQAEDISSSEEDEGDTNGGRLVSPTTGGALVDGDVVAINSGEMQDTPDQQYIYGSRVDFCNDVTHEIRPPKELSQVSARAIADVACGMLNSRGGSIYFGVSEDQIVQGIKIKREVRDSFRLGIDEMMIRQISPPVLYIQFEMIYTPVFKATYRPPPHDYIQVTDLYIAELGIRPSRGTLHSTKDCLYRFGDRTLPLTIKEVRELVVVAEEDVYKEEIFSLRQKLKNLRDRRLTS